MKRGLSIPLLLFAGLLVWTLVTPRQPLLNTAPPEAAEDERAPDSYGENVIALEYGPDGALLDRTDARALRRFNGAGLVELDAPRRESFGADGNWSASAERGRLYERREALQLLGDVALRNPEKGVEFRSDAMLLNFREQTARSQAPVEAWQGDNRIEASQLLLNLQTEVAVLRGNVRSVYVPER